MNRLVLLAVLGLVLIGLAAPTFAQTSVGVSVGINQPGVYGRVDIGNLPPPPVILPQPVIITPAPVAVHRAPVYLYVPPGHQKKWAKHCGQYNACGQPVYFVRDEWVRERYEHEHPGWNNGRHRGQEKHDDHGNHGNNGKGHGHDKDKH